MLYHLAPYVKDYWPTSTVLESVCFRSLAALLTSFAASCVIGTWFIAKSQQFFRSKTREWAPERHKEKGEMPTMGGLFVIMAVLATALLWCNLASALVWIMLLSLTGFGAIGFWDDWCKIKYKKGMSGSLKIKLQWSVAAFIAFLMVFVGNVSTVVAVPLLKPLSFDLGLLYIPWAMFILVGCSNAVNLTDGLDGLATGVLIPVFSTFSFISYCAGSLALAGMFAIPYAGTTEIAIVGLSLVGACLGFLWYNAHPATIFMGDVGSLAFGGALATMALMAKQEPLLPIAGGVFVVETVSVIAQVLSYRLRGKKIFKMAPIHHHFELNGWAESKITVRFWIISLILCTCALGAFFSPCLS